MHQGNAINPWINYPYETNTLMRAAADACHAAGMKFKVYNTMRELSSAGARFSTAVSTCVLSGARCAGSRPWDVATAARASGL